MPKPKPGESRNDFIGRCMSDPHERELRPDADARFARCNGIWESERLMKPNEKLLKAIRERTQKQTEFHYGITTADKYARTLEECVGHSACDKFAGCKLANWEAVLNKAANTLVYSNEDMTADKRVTSLTNWKEILNLQDSQLELPKNTLLLFSHTLTTPRKDRDGDRLRSEGAIIDPKMLLLWQHIPTLPIGKMIATVEHNTRRIRNVSAIIDMNELCHDAAVMLDNGMGRFSHGFRALMFEALKEDDHDSEEYHDDGTPNGFDITKFEIMEESLVSVPSNVDAEVDEVILGLVEGGKLTSPLMKQLGTKIRDARPLSVAIKENIDDENISRDRSCSAKDGEGKEGCTCGASKEAHEDSSKEASAAGNSQVKQQTDESTTSNKDAKNDQHLAETKSTESSTESQEDTDKKEIACSECGGEMDDGKCTKCGYEEGKSKEVETKAGRVLSQRNLTKLTDVKEDLEELKGGVHISTRAGSAICERCITKLEEVIADAGGAPTTEEEDTRQMSVDRAIGEIISNADKDDLARLKGYLEALETVDASLEIGRQYRTFVTG